MADRMDSQGAVGRKASHKPLLRHYLEMVAAMAVGMLAYGILFRSPLDPLGYRGLLSEHPYINEFIMLFAMSLSMAAFMAYRKHTWRHTAEMVAAMAIPDGAVAALTASSAFPIFSVDTLTLWTHAAMLLGMFLLMLIRRADYAHPHGHDHQG